MEMRCKNCGTEMSEIIVSEGCNGDDIVEWCENCGTLIRYYDSRNSGPEPDDWKTPSLLAVK